MRLDATTQLHYQDEDEYAPMCAQREANGFNSGMGALEVLRTQL